MAKPLTHKDLARFDALDARSWLTDYERVEHRDLAIRIAREHRTTDAVRAAARDLRRLAGEAWGNVEGDRANDTSAALLNCALDVMLDGAAHALPYVDAQLAGIKGAEDYRAQAREILATLAVKR